LKIAIIAPPWAPVPPNLYGGIELVVDRQARGFKDLGHDVTLFTTGDSTCPVDKRFILPTSEGRRIGSSVPEARHVMFCYENVSDYDIIHDHSVLGPVLAAYCNLTIPVVTTVHGPFNDELRDIYSRIDSRVSIVAISHSQAKSAPEIKVSKVIHHGLNASEFPFKKDKGDFLLFLGRMAKEKGAHIAIEVAKTLGEKLIIAGKKREVWEEKYFHDYVAPHLNEQVTYLGEVQHEEKLQLLANAKALLFPITWPEPFGMVMLEAFACGTPVIGFAHGAAPEVINDGQTGFVVNDVDEMIGAVKKIDQISPADCRFAVETYFSQDRMVKEHIELFEELIKNI
jgi:glycosyltransferase involved in cell wall biosynthesis